MGSINAVILSEFKGKIEFENIIEGLTFREEVMSKQDREKVTMNPADKKKIPMIKVVDSKGAEMRSYTVGSHITVDSYETIRKIL
ncbi:MAG: hypothetical protein R2728_15315 [Chitinophagales bacterium]